MARTTFYKTSEYTHTANVRTKTQCKEVKRRKFHTIKVRQARVLLGASSFICKSGVEKEKGANEESRKLRK